MSRPPGFLCFGHKAPYLFWTQSQPQCGPPPVSAPLCKESGADPLIFPTPTEASQSHHRALHRVLGLPNLDLFACHCGAGLAAAAGCVRPPHRRPPPPVAPLRWLSCRCVADEEAFSRAPRRREAHFLLPYGGISTKSNTQIRTNQRAGVREGQPRDIKVPSPSQPGHSFIMWGGDSHPSSAAPLVLHGTPSRSNASACLAPPPSHFLTPVLAMPLSHCERYRLAQRQTRPPIPLLAWDGRCLGCVR